MSDRPSSGFRASPDELRQTGDTAVETASVIPGELKALVDASRQSAAGLSGLRCGAALDDCTGAWNTLVTGLHTRMSRQGQSLLDAADGYASTDRRISTAFGPDTRTTATTNPTGPTAAQRQNFVLHFG
ncbi:WXG100 family type VII secretion target [Kitasatospora sp. NPDC093550]|uniref:WXG100 family type VII secretion target n=1 Tax=Kitasatospora sp. NPDC093550 TaxID=3364089 RepID=UPI00382A6E47